MVRERVESRKHKHQGDGYFKDGTGDEKYVIDGK